MYSAPTVNEARLTGLAVVPTASHRVRVVQDTLPAGATEPWSPNGLGMSCQPPPVQRSAKTTPDSYGPPRVPTAMQNAAVWHDTLANDAYTEGSPRLRGGVWVLMTCQRVPFQRAAYGLTDPSG